MKKYNYIIPILTTILLPTLTYADCTSEEIKHFKEIESDYRIVSTLNKETGYYSITLYNPEPDKYTYLLNNGITDTLCTINDDSNSQCDGIIPGNYTVFILGKTGTCDSTLKRMFLKLSPYNKYSEDSLCKGIEEFVLCQETYDKEIDYDTFVSRINIYKNNKIQNEKEEKKELIDINKITEYVEENLFQIIVIVIFIIILIATIILTIKSVQKSRRLE